MYVVTVAPKPGTNAGGAFTKAQDSPAMNDFVEHFEQLKDHFGDNGVVVTTKKSTDVVTWALHALRLRDLAVGIGIGEVRSDSLQEGPLAGTGVTASKNALLGAQKQGQIAPAKVEVAYARRAPAHRRRVRR